MDCASDLSKHLPHQDSYIFREQNSFWFLFWLGISTIVFCFPSGTISITGLWSWRKTLSFSASQRH